MEPFVALMRRYCIDYTNSHDQSVCDEIMHPDYVVHIAQADLPRDLLYKPAVKGVFERFPGLGLVVHELVTNGDRLAMRFSEHGAAPAEGGRYAAWGGIGVYRWNGAQLLENFVEPKVMGHELEIHPLVVLVVTAIGGIVGGIVGLVLAVPITVIALSGFNQLRSRGYVERAAESAGRTLRTESDQTATES